jgi:3-oxoacyl-[acyl-carrier-protein] synthase III
MNAQLRSMALWVPETIVQSEFESFRRPGDGGNRTEPDPLLDVHAGEGEASAIMRALIEDERRDPKRGTRERRVSHGETSAEAEARAATIAMKRAGVLPREISHVLSWCMVPDDIGPHAPRVAHLAGIEHAFAINVDVACASVVAQLELSCALIESGRARTVLATQSHLLSRALPQGSRLAPFVGDAATAFIVSGGSKSSKIHFASHSDGSASEAVVWSRIDGSRAPWYASGAQFAPGTRDREKAQSLVTHTLDYGATTVREACALAGTRPQDLEVLATVQPRRWVPEGIARALGMQDFLAPTTFERFAHLGGCGVIANLLEAKQRGLLREGAMVALYAQGAGFTRAAAIAQWA